MTQPVYEHCQTLLFLAMSKCGRYEAMIEFAILSLENNDEEQRRLASEYLRRRLSEIKLEHEQKLQQL